MAEGRGRRWALEVVVIVFSILLAFAIDAGWENRQERIQAQRILTNLEEDFRSNLAEAEAVIGRHERRRALVMALQRRSDAEIRSIPADSLGRYYLALLDPRSFDPNG